MAFLPNSNTEKVKKYTSIIANNTNFTNSATSADIAIAVGDVILSCTSTGTQGTGAAGAYVIPAATASSYTGAVVLGVVIALRQFNGEQQLSQITIGTLSNANTTSSTPYVVDWIAAKDTTVEWIADLVTANAGASTDYVQGYNIAGSAASTTKSNQGNLVAGTLGSSIFTSYKWNLDSTGLLSKAVGRFNPYYCI